MDVGGAALIPAGDDGGELYFAVHVGELIAAEPALTGGGFAALGRIDAAGVAVPDVDLDVLHGGTTFLAIEDVESESERDAGLGVGAIEVGKNVGAQVAGGAVVDEVRAFFAFERGGAAG